MENMKSGDVVNQFTTKDVGLAAAMVLNGFVLVGVQESKRVGGTGGGMKKFVFEVHNMSAAKKVEIEWVGKQMTGNLVEFWENTGRLRKMLHNRD